VLLFFASRREIFVAHRVGQISARVTAIYSNMAFNGDFTPVLAKHSKSFSLIDCVSVGVDRMQRNFEPMRKQVEAWQRSELTDVTAKVVIYEAFVEGKLEAPKHLARALERKVSRRTALRLQPSVITNNRVRRYLRVSGSSTIGPVP
jgi:hypothetical protein